MDRTLQLYTYVVQGGLALVKANKMGQTSIEIFNCTNHMMTIEKGQFLELIIC